MAQPDRPRRRRWWPGLLIVFGLLLALAGGGVFVVEANNHATCSGGVAALAGTKCIGYNVAYDAGAAVLAFGLTLLLGGIIAAAMPRR